MIYKFNLTQHTPTETQVQAGVASRTASEEEEIKKLLTFPTTGEHSVHQAGEVRKRAEALAEIAAQSGYDQAMIGGAPYLMGALERALINRGIEPIYSISERRSVETVQIDGSVRKESQFVHEGWFTPPIDVIQDCDRWLEGLTARLKQQERDLPRHNGEEKTPFYVSGALVCPGDGDFGYTVRGGAAAYWCNLIERLEGLISTAFVTLGNGDREWEANQLPHTESTCLQKGNCSYAPTQCPECTSFILA